MGKTCKLSRDAAQYARILLGHDSQFLTFSPAFHQRVTLRYSFCENGDSLMPWAGQEVRLKPFCCTSLVSPWTRAASSTAMTAERCCTTYQHPRPTVALRHQTNFFSKGGLVYALCRPQQLTHPQFFEFRALSRPWCAATACHTLHHRVAHVP